MTGNAKKNKNHHSVLLNINNSLNGLLHPASRIDHWQALAVRPYSGSYRWDDRLARPAFVKERHDLSWVLCWETKLFDSHRPDTCSLWTPRPPHVSEAVKFSLIRNVWYSLIGGNQSMRFLNQSLSSREELLHHELQFRRSSWGTFDLVTTLLIIAITRSAA